MKHLAVPGLRPGAVSPLPAPFRYRPAEPQSVRAFKDRLAADGVEIVDEWEEPEYVSVKFLDPDGYIVEAASEPAQES
jgi:catechol 2,3-dioxygenase-like lactoylglutathione lyase family enzyme